MFECKVIQKCMRLSMLFDLIKPPGDRQKGYSIRPGHLVFNSNDKPAMSFDQNQIGSVHVMPMRYSVLIVMCCCLGRCFKLEPKRLVICQYGQITII